MSALLTAGCGSLRDEVAATVGGEDISVQAVAELAESPLAQLVAQGATRPADVQRAVLGLLVQDRLFDFEVRRRGGRPDDADLEQGRAQADQIEQQGTQLAPADRELVERLVANQSALFRLGLAERPEIDDAAIAEYFEANREQFPDRLTCLDGLVAPPGAVAELIGLIEGGASFEDAIATRSDEVFPIEQTGPSTCVAPGTITTPGLSTIVEEGPVGEIQQFETTGQVGQPVVLVLRVSSRAPVTGTEPTVVDQIRQALQEADQASQQDEVRALLDEVVRRADVVVDPRYGRFDATSPSVIVAPPVPRPAAEATVPSAVLGG